MLNTQIWLVHIMHIISGSILQTSQAKINNPHKC